MIAKDTELALMLQTHLELAVKSLNRVADALESIAKTQDCIFECQRSSAAAARAAMDRVEAVRAGRV